MAPERNDDAAWRRAYRATLAAEPSGCPGDEALAALALGELAPDERSRVADHVTACVRCAGDYRLLAEMHREASAVQRPAARWLWPAAAAAAVAIASVVVLRVGTPRPPADGTRGARTAQVAPRPDAQLVAPPAQLSWSAEPGARGYRAHLFDARAERMWEGETTSATTVSLPAEVRARLIPGAAYFWVVDVEGAEAARRLGPFWFHIKSGG